MMLLKQGITQELDSVRKEMRHDFGLSEILDEKLEYFNSLYVSRVANSHVNVLSIVIGPKY